MVGLGKQLLKCPACGQVFYRDALPADTALLGPLVQHPDPAHPERDCRGSGSIGTPLGLGHPPEGARAG